MTVRKRGEPWCFLVDVPTPYNPTVRAGGRPDVPWGRAWLLARAADRKLVEVEANAAAMFPWFWLRTGSVIDTPAPT